MQETTLHLQLKEIYQQEGGQPEIWVDGYLIDVVQSNQLIEIQTRNFGALKQKLNDLLDNHPLRVIYPIAREKFIILKDLDGNPIRRRRSPRQGKLVDLFNELVYIASWAIHPNFSLEVFLIIEEEIRVMDGKGSWRRHGISIQDRRLVKILERHLFSCTGDYQCLFPGDLSGQFTNKQLARLLSIPHRLASKMTYTSLSLGILASAGKQGNALSYHFTPQFQR